MSAKTARLKRQEERRQNGGMTKKEWARHRSETEYRMMRALPDPPDDEPALTEDQMAQLQAFMAQMGSVS